MHTKSLLQVRNDPTLVPAVTHGQRLETIEFHQEGSEHIETGEWETIQKAQVLQCWFGVALEGHDVTRGNKPAISASHP